MRIDSVAKTKSQKNTQVSNTTFKGRKKTPQPLLKPKIPKISITESFLRVADSFKSTLLTISKILIP